MTRQNKHDSVEFEKEIAGLKMLPADSLEENYPLKKYENIDRNSHDRFQNNDDDNRFENFYFDPNTATSSDWIRLGIRKKTVETIQKYLSRGGHFYRSEDIKKIWGLNGKDITRLLPYVRIRESAHDHLPASFSRDKDATTSYASRPVAMAVDINTADTSLFIALPGIGSKLAQRIIKFRDQLGGFYSIEQLGETFGLPDSTFQKIKNRLLLKDPEIKKININTATIAELKAHPYIRYAIANAICQYRLQHGNFMFVTDIQKVMAVNGDTFKKLAPYLTVEAAQ